MAFLKMSKGRRLYLCQTLNGFGRRLAQGFTPTRLWHARRAELLHPLFLRVNRLCAADPGPPLCSERHSIPSSGIEEEWSVQRHINLWKIHRANASPEKSLWFSDKACRGRATLHIHSVFSCFIALQTSANLGMWKQRIKLVYKWSENCDMFSVYPPNKIRNSWLHLEVKYSPAVCYLIWQYRWSHQLLSEIFCC